MGPLQLLGNCVSSANVLLFAGWRLSLNELLSWRMAQSELAFVAARTKQLPLRQLLCQPQ